MDIEQPALGNIGVDTFTITAAWSWERGWRVVSSRRLSGAQTHLQRSWDGLSALEAFAVVEEEASAYFATQD